jgi:hypothetical protein
MPTLYFIQRRCNRYSPPRRFLHCRKADRIESRPNIDKKTDRKTYGKTDRQENIQPDNGQQTDRKKIMQEARQMRVRQQTNRKADRQEGRQKKWFTEEGRHTGGQKTRGHTDRRIQF